MSGDIEVKVPMSVVDIEEALGVGEVEAEKATLREASFPPVVGVTEASESKVLTAEDIEALKQTLTTAPHNRVEAELREAPSISVRAHLRRTDYDWLAARAEAEDRTAASMLGRLVRQARLEEQRSVELSRRILGGLKDQTPGEPMTVVEYTEPGPFSLANAPSWAVVLLLVVAAIVFMAIGYFAAVPS